jgi:hypothetical protein
LVLRSVNARRAAPGTPQLPPKQETVIPKGITMWGASATGKTSFLAALYTALIAEQNGWRLRGEDTASTQALVGFTNEPLVSGKPEAGNGLALVWTAPPERRRRDPDARGRHRRRDRRR